MSYYVERFENGYCSRVGGKDLGVGLSYVYLPYGQSEGHLQILLLYIYHLFGQWLD